MSKVTRLEDIPFAETLAPEPAAPPLRDLAAREQDKRHQAALYWLRHPKDGILNTIFHHVLKWCPSAFVSNFGQSLVPLMRWSYRDKIFPDRIKRNYAALTAGRWTDELDEKNGLDRWWRNIARTVSEFCVVNSLWEKSNIEVEGLEYLRTAQQRGGPVIFTSMHLATWEALFVAIHNGLAGPSIGPFQPETNRFKNRIIHAIRRKRNQYLFPPGQRSAYRLHRLMVSGNYSMTIFIDEVRDNQVHLPCFGRQPPRKGNAVVAVKIANSCGGTLLPTYMTRTGPARFKLVFCPPLNRPDSEKPYPIAETVLAFNDVFEPIVLENIEEWYMLGELRLPKKFEEGAYAKGLALKNSGGPKR